MGAILQFLANRGLLSVAKLVAKYLGKYQVITDFAIRSKSWIFPSCGLSAYQLESKQERWVSYSGVTNAASNYRSQRALGGKMIKQRLSRLVFAVFVITSCLVYTATSKAILNCFAYVCMTCNTSFTYYPDVGELMTITCEGSSDSTTKMCFGGYWQVIYEDCGSGS